MSYHRFASWLAPRFRQHVALKKAGGCDYSSQAWYLAVFDRYLVEQDASAPLVTSVLRDYLATLSHLSPRARDNAVSVVWQALAYARRHGDPIEPSPERPRSASTWYRLREPFVLSHRQVERLLEASLKLAPRRLFARSTHACLLGLLYVSGLRIAEALALDVGDLDRRQETLLVRAGKFKKQRLLPLPTSTVAALVRYVDDSLRPLGRDPDAPFFVSRRRRRLSYGAAKDALQKAAELSALKDEAGRLPRLHDLRHTFAVHRVAAWYRAGRDVNALLPVLSTYMGHVSPAYTYTYLRSAELLFGEAARRFERSAGRLLDGRPA